MPHCPGGRNVTAPGRRKADQSGPADAVPGRTRGIFKRTLSPVAKQGGASIAHMVIPETAQRLSAISAGGAGADVGDPGSPLRGGRDDYIRRMRLPEPGAGRGVACKQAPAASRCRLGFHPG